MAVPYSLKGHETDWDVLLGTSVEINPVCCPTHHPTMLTAVVSTLFGHYTDRNSKNTLQVRKHGTALQFIILAYVANFHNYFTTVLRNKFAAKP